MVLVIYLKWNVKNVIRLFHPLDSLKNTGMEFIVKNKSAKSVAKYLIKVATGDLILIVVQAIFSCLTQ